MKVKPIIKHPLNENELRVINVDHDAISELLFENLMDCQEQYFGIKRGDGNCMCMMHWDSDKNVLTYAVARETDLVGTVLKELNYDKLRRDVGFTTDSLFSAKRFISLPLNHYTMNPRKGKQAENQEKYFGVEIGDDTYHCFMNWNADDETLTYAVVRIADIINKEIDFEKLFRNVGITTDSLFSPKCLASGCFVTVPLDRYTTPKPTPICKAP